MKIPDGSIIKHKTTVGLVVEHYKEFLCIMLTEKYSDVYRGWNGTILVVEGAVELFTPKSLGKL